jgi:hypothetical protein
LRLQLFSAKAKFSSINALIIWMLLSLGKRISRKERKDAKILKEYETSKKSLRLYPENKSYS